MGGDALASAEDRVVELERELAAARSTMRTAAQLLMRDKQRGAEAARLLLEARLSG